MERGAERQRGDNREAVEEKSSVERQWGEAEVLALISVWDEIGAQHVAENRATFELISERLRRLSFTRSWRECQAKSRSLGLQSRKPDAAADTSATYSSGVDARPVEGWEEDVGNQRGIYPSSASLPMHEGKCGFHTHCGTDNNSAQLLTYKRINKPISSNNFCSLALKTTDSYSR